MPEPTDVLRRIRSFVRREGRMTSSQQKALANYWSHYGLDVEQDVFDFKKIFNRTAPVCLEIGFGMGQSLLAMAIHQPEWDFIGIEVHRPGVGCLLAGVAAQTLNNVRVVCADAIEVLQIAIPDQSLDRVQLFFPDPWPKKRHHKRRIVQAAFVKLIQHKLKSTGEFHLATDWEEYAQHMLIVMDQTTGFKNLSTSNSFITRPESRPITRFETRGKKLGHQIWDLVFVKI